MPLHHTWRTRVLPLLVLLVGCLTGVALAEDEKPKVSSPWVPEVTGKAVMQCQCVLATSGCRSEFFWRLAGSPTHSWSQEIHVREDHELDLDLLCYKKRDVDKLGDGLCCPIDEEDGEPDEDQLRRFFGVSEIHVVESGQGAVS